MPLLTADYAMGRGVFRCGNIHSRASASACWQVRWQDLSTDFLVRAAAWCLPLLIWLCRLEDKAAFSSAIAVILPLCIVSIVIYALHDSLPVSDALPYLIGGAAGGVLAGLLFRKMPARALHLILGGVILAGGIRLIVC